MPSTLAARIASARRYARLSQAELAQRVGVSRPAVSQWENLDPEKGTSPSRDNLVAISAATGAPLDWLTDDSSDVPPNWLVPQDWENRSDLPSVLGGDDYLSMPAFSRRPTREPPMSSPYLQRVAREANQRATTEIAQRGDTNRARELLEHYCKTEPELRDQHQAHELIRFALAVQDQFVFIPLLAFNVSAGHGRTDASPEVLNWYSFRRDWLVDVMDLNTEQCGLVFARGDSGEPDIRDRDLLLVDFRVQVISAPGTYVIAIDGEYMVKQAQRNWDRSITISSANPSYPSQTVPADQAESLTVVGLVRSQQRRR